MESNVCENCHEMKGFTGRPFVKLCSLHDAAPALLEALEALTDLGEHLAEEHLPAEDDPVEGFHVRKFNRLLDKARAALALAKGVDHGS